MKKFYYVLVAAVALSAVLSCNKEKTEVPGDNTPATDKAGTVTWHFTAEVENPVTKMGDMDSDGNFAWANGDVVTIIYDGGTTTAEAAVAEGKTTFEPEIPEGITEIWLVYPSGMTASLNSGNLVINMPAVQKDALAGYFVAKAAAGAASISFMHPVCYYKMVVDGDGTDVTSLELSSAAGNALTAETLSLSFDADGVPSATPVNGASSLNVSFSGAGTYYIPVVPGISPAGGDLKFQFKRTENEAPVNAGAYKHSAAIENTRASIKNWGSLPARATNRYVSTSGSGSADGTTKGSPWTIAQFKSFMEPSTASDRDLFDGLNIHFAAGTYTPSAKIAPNTPIRVNLIGEDAATTIFDGNSSMLLFDIYKQSGETVNFKNFTIKNANNTGSDGGAFRIGNSTRVFNISFEDCAFVNNQASASNKYGGVFYVTGATTMTLKNCSFIKNHAMGYGGVMTVASGSTATVSFENCTFGDGTYENRNYANSGSAFHSANTQTHSFTDCEFNYNQGTGNWGSVIYLTGSVNSKLLVNRCLFKNNISKNRGTVSANGPRAIYLNDVTFKDNTVTDATGYGSCVHANNQTVVCLNNVTSYNNRCSNGSPTDNNWSFNSDGSLLMVNSTIVDGTPKHVFRALTETSKVALCNNIVINTVGEEPFTIHENAKCVNNGHNFISAPTAQGYLPDAATDLFSIDASTLGGSYSEEWNTTNKYGVYAWAWTNSLGSFTPATKTEVENTIKEYDYTIAGVSSVGLDFHNWLSSIGALGKDARGVTRSGNWWPGAYQN